MRVLVSSIQRGYLPGSLKVQDVINAASTADFTLKTDPAVHFERGEAVEIQKDDGTRVFTGFLSSPGEKLPGLNGPVVFTKCQCRDNHYLAEKRRVAKSYSNTSAGAIVNDLITTYLAAEGITAGTVQAGPSVLKAVFNYWRVADALAEIAERSNFAWWIDKDRKLFFQARDALTAPFTLSLEDCLLGSIDLDDTAPNYRNRQWIRGVSDVTSTQTEEFKGDGETRTFPLGYPLDAAPTVKVNAVAKTVDTKANQRISTAAWFYTLGDPILTQNDSETILGSGDVLTVEYVGRFSLVVQVQDTSQQTEMLSREGVGTGIVEDVVDDTTLTSVIAGSEKAQQLLDRYAQDARTLKFKTLKTGLEIGQALTVLIPDHGLNSVVFLIEEMETDEIPMTDRLLFSLSCSSGPVGDTWLKWLTQLLRVGDRINQAITIGDVGEDAVVQVFSFAKTWGSNEVPEVFEDVYPAVTLFPQAANLRPGFPDQVIGWFAWGNGVPTGTGLGNELGRKQVTSFIKGAPSPHRTIVLLNTDEANVAITEIAWFGGHRASSTANSGVLIQAVAWTKTKTSADIFQLMRTDTKGY